MHFGRLFFCVNDLSILHILRPPVQQDSRCGRHAKTARVLPSVVRSGYPSLAVRAFRMA